MSFLLDTNVLLRSTEPSHPMYEEAVNATNTLLGRGEELWLAPQNLTPVLERLHAPCGEEWAGTYRNRS